MHYKLIPPWAPHAMPSYIHGAAAEQVREVLREQALAAYSYEEAVLAREIKLAEIHAACRDAYHAATSKDLTAAVKGWSLTPIIWTLEAVTQEYDSELEAIPWDGDPNHPRRYNEITDWGTTKGRPEIGNSQTSESSCLEALATHLIGMLGEEHTQGLTSLLQSKAHYLHVHGRYHWPTIGLRREKSCERWWQLEVRKAR